MSITEHDHQIAALKEQLEAIRHQDPKQAERLCRRLLDLAGDTNDALNACCAEYHLTILAAAEEEPLQSLMHIRRTRQLCLTVPGTEGWLVRLDNLEGIAYIRRGEYVQAMQCFLSAIQKAELADDAEVLMRLWISIAGIYLHMNQFSLVQQCLDKAQMYIRRLPDSPHRAFSQRVLDIDQATVYANTGSPEKVLALLDASFGEQTAEMNDLMISVQCLRAEAEKQRGNAQRAAELLAPLMQLTVSSALSLGTLMEAWRISYQLAVECGDQPGAKAALDKIDKAYGQGASPDNLLELSKLRVNYHQKFGDQNALMAALNDFYAYSAQCDAQEQVQTAQALETQMQLSNLQAEMEKAQRDGLRLQALSVKDALTGLANRRAWRARLHQNVEDAKAARETVGVALLDLDHFKEYNDRFGHLFGDKLLCAAARALSIDTERFFPGRYGGDEFILLFRGMDEKQVDAMLDRAFAYLKTAQESDDYADMPRITFSAGYVIAIAQAVEQESALIEQADQAMYQVKKGGRNRYCGRAFCPDQPPLP